MDYFVGTPQIQILHKCTMFGICDVILFTNEARPGIISYEIRDDIKKLNSCNKDNFIENIIPIYETGDFAISSKLLETPVELVDKLAAQLSQRYSELNLLAYQQAISHGHNA